MTELLEDSTESDKSTIAHASDLLTYYSFELGNHTVTQLLDQWLQDYPVSWVRLAVIEALFQGRYKAISVSQILQFWQRREQPLHRFSYEFERLVCNKFPRNLNQPTASPLPLIARPQPTVLPLLPSASSTGNPYLPAWTALAAQIQQESTAPAVPFPALKAVNSAGGDCPAVPPLPPNLPETEPEPTPPPTGTAAQLMHPSLEMSFPSHSGIQANVAALIEQASSNLNASAEAMKTKLRTNAPNGQLPAALTAPATALTPTIAPDPIPSAASPPSELLPSPADFHAKLKAVAEQQVETKEDTK